MWSTDSSADESAMWQWLDADRTGRVEPKLCQCNLAMASPENPSRGLPTDPQTLTSQISEFFGSPNWSKASRKLATFLVRTSDIPITLSPQVLKYPTHNRHKDLIFYHFRSLVRGRGYVLHTKVRMFIAFKRFFVFAFLA